MASPSRLSHWKYGIAMAVTGAPSTTWPSAVTSIVWPMPRQGDGTLAEHAARPDDQVLQARAVELVGLLEAVDERAALDGDAAAHRVHAPVRVGPARGHVQVQRHQVARLPGAADDVVAR